MRFFLVSFALLCSGGATFAQLNAHEDYQQLIRQEQHTASRKINFQANPNTQNYDIRHHKIEIKVNPANYFIEGKVTSTFVPDENLSQIVFDLTDALTVSGVKQGNADLVFTHQNDELTIQLSQSVPQGTEGEVEISYSGEPSTANNAFTISQHNGVPIMWTLSEPFGAKDWWPCKDDLNDKAEKIDFYITAPSAYVVAANGLELDQTDASGGFKTTHFQHNYPIPAYLIAFTVTNYQLYTQQAGTAPHTFPIVNYFYPESYETAVDQVAVTVDIMNLYEELFETYPFHEEKYGHAQFGWGGGMEHTTVSFMGGFSRGLIAHELAHHWFGNKITCGTWKDIWLNEGFAEYLAGLVVEHLDGVNNFISWKASKIQSITSQAGGNLYLNEEQAEDSNRIFSSRITYNKGSMVVHMLRYVLGDENFFKGIKNYLADPDLAYGAAVTSQLKQHLETASGRDLTEFFNDWIYGEGYPVYHADVQMIGSRQAKIVLSQTTSHPSVDFFEMPVKIKISSNEGQSEIVTLHHTENQQQIVVDLPFSSIGEVTIDPERDIITRDNEVDLSGQEFQSSNQNIDLIPNPATSEIDVAINGDIVINQSQLYNAEGKIIETKIDLPYNISALSSGWYTLMLSTNSGIYHKKFLKK